MTHDKFLSEFNTIYRGVGPQAPFGHVRTRILGSAAAATPQLGRPKDIQVDQQVLHAFGGSPRRHITVPAYVVAYRSGRLRAYVIVSAVHGNLRRHP